MKLKHLFFAVAASTLAAACSEADELVSGNQSQNTLDAIHSGTDRFATRVNLNSEWESGDAIGVYMLDAGTGNIRNSAMNIQYNADVQVTSTTTDFTAANGGIGIYDQPCDFVAYYPYASDEEDKVDAGAGIYKVDLADQSAGISMHDLMWVKVADKSTEELKNNGLTMTFKHQLALLQVHVTGNVAAESVTVSGLNTAATFDLLNGTLSEGSAPKSVSLYKTAEPNVFVGIVLPTVELRQKMKLTIAASGKKYQYTVPETSTVEEFVAGNKYEYTIDIENNSGSLEGGEGGNTPWQPGGNEEGKGDEILDNKDIPEDYDQIIVKADTDLSTILNGAEGKKALVFTDAEATYNVETLTVPERVTELMLIAGGNKPVKLVLKQITHSGLVRFAMNNLEVVGDKSVVLLTNNETSQFAADAKIEFKNCNISTMKALCEWSTGDTGTQNLLASFAVENCQINDLESVFNYYGTKKMTVTNSTICNITERAFYVKDANGVVVTVENCTLVGLAKTPFESRYGNGNLYYKNNISACFVKSNPNIAYKMDVQAFEGNYAAKSEVAEQLAVVNVHGSAVNAESFPNAWTDLTKTQAQLFDGVNNEGEFYTTITTAGDPRWRQAAQ